MVSLCWGATAGAAPLAPDSAPLEAWVAPAGTRIRPQGSPEGAGGAAHLTAVRGETESVFVVVKRPAQGTRGLAVTLSPLRGPQGRLQRVRIYRAAFVDVDGEQLADALIPLQADLKGTHWIKVDPEHAENLPLWVEVQVPRDAVAGEYTGAVQVRLGAAAVEVPIAVTVLPGQLPQRASLPTAFDFSAADAALANEDIREPEKVLQLGRGYALAALEDRITLVGGMFSAPTYRVMPGDGSMVVDFSDFDRQLSPFMEGIAELGGARSSAITLPVPTGLSLMDKFKYQLALKKHMSERGWDDRVLEFADSSTPDRGLLVAQKAQARGWRECRDAAESGEGDRYWWKIPDAHGKASLRLGADGMAPRAIGWLAYNSGALGLRYGSAVEGFNRAPVSENGPKSALFYPGYAVDASGRYEVIESVRLKLLRDGLEDYELLSLARASGHAGLAQSWARRMAASPEVFAQDPAQYDAAKADLAAAIVAVAEPHPGRKAKLTPPR